MKTLIERLADEARETRTADAHVYLVRLLRERDGEESEAYERLGRSVPLSVLRLPGVPTMEDLGEEANETPFVGILHGDSATLVPLSRLRGK